MMNCRKHEGRHREGNGKMQTIKESINYWPISQQLARRVHQLIWLDFSFFAAHDHPDRKKENNSTL